MRKLLKSRDNWTEFTDMTVSKPGPKDFEFGFTSKDNRVRTRWAMMTCIGFTPDRKQIERGLNDFLSNIRQFWVGRPDITLSAYQIERAINDDEESVIQAVITRQDVNLTKEQEYQILNGKNTDIKASLLLNPSFKPSPELVLTLFKRNNPSDLACLSLRGDLIFAQEQIDTISRINDGIWYRFPFELDTYGSPTQVIRKMVEKAVEYRRQQEDSVNANTSRRRI